MGRATRGVRAEPVGRGDRHADIALEGPCKYAAVQNPPGAGTLNEGEATMGNCPPHMVPGGARPAGAQGSEDVPTVYPRAGHPATFELSRDQELSRDTLSRVVTRAIEHGDGHVYVL